MSRKMKHPLLLLCICGEGAEIMMAQYAVFSFTAGLYHRLKSLMAWVKNQKKHPDFTELLDITLAYPRPVCLSTEQIAELTDATLAFTDVEVVDARTDQLPDGEQVDYLRCRVGAESVIWEIGPQHYDGEANTSDVFETTLDELARQAGLGGL